MLVSVKAQLFEWAGDGAQSGCLQKENVLKNHFNITCCFDFPI